MQPNLLYMAPSAKNSRFSSDYGRITSELSIRGFSRNLDSQTVRDSRQTYGGLR